MLTCREITELVTDYAEGRLSFPDRLRFQLHLGLCRNCRAYVRQVRATASALGKLPPPAVPPELEQELMRRFEGWKKRRA
jgi:anti-sigma factor RsiW